MKRRDFLKAASAITASLAFVCVLLSCSLFLTGCNSLAENNPNTDKSLAENNVRLKKLMAAVESGEIAYKLTGSDEIKAILGEPQKEEERVGGGMDRREGAAVCLCVPVDRCTCGYLRPPRIPA